MSKKKLAKNVAWMFSGNVIYALCLWLQLLLIAKYSDAWTLGTFTISLAVSAPVFMFMNLQLRSIQVTDAKREYTFGDFISLRLATSSLSIIAIFLFFGLYYGLDKSFYILLLVSLLKCSESISEIFNSRQQLNEKMHFVSASLSIRGIGNVLGVGVGLLFFQNLVIGLLLSLVSNLLVLVFVDYRNSDLSKDDALLVFFRKNNIKILLKKGMPLGIVMLIVSINTNVPKYFIESLLGRSEQGIYSTLAYFIVVGNFVISAVGQSFIPRMSKYYADKKYAEFQKLSNVFSALCILSGVTGILIAWILGDWVLRSFFGPEFWVYHEVLILIMVCGTFAYISSSFGYTMTAMRIFKPQPWINFLVLVVGALASYALISKYGLIGACVGGMITFGVQALLIKIVIEKNLRYSLKRV